MDEIIKYLSVLLADMITSALTSLYHNYIPLGLAILTAALMKVYVNTEKLKQSLLNKPRVSIFASVAFGAFTPLCACGTMAVVIGLLTTALPWGTVMAFLTSSPLMSPDTFIMIAGVLSVRFAIALTIASVIIGIASGVLTNVIEKKTNYLKNQLRFHIGPQLQTCSCSDAVSEAACTCNSVITHNKQHISAPVCGCSCSSVVQEKTLSKTANFFIKLMNRIRIKEIGRAIIDIGLKQILLYFVIFAAVGYLVQHFIPTSLIVSLFSGESIFSVPLAALLGLPLYVSGEGAIPLIRALMDGGAGEGAMMAFMITGPATSAWVIAGITAFMKKRVIGLYVGFVFIGGVVIGYLYQLAIAFLLT